MITNAITVCVNYDDYLVHTLPNNRRFFTNYYIVTDPKNQKIIRPLVEKSDAKLIVTNKFYESQASFNKGKALDEALKKIPPGWTCHLDADILLPENFETNNLEMDTIYGIPRMMCPTIDEFKKYKQSFHPSNARNEKPENEWVEESFGLNKVTSSVVRRKPLLDYLEEKPEKSHRYTIYFPIGYFQLFYHENTEYPRKFKYAGRSDVEFALKWDKHKELCGKVIHLPIVNGKAADNWWGRKSSKFDPDNHIPANS